MIIFIELCALSKPTCILDCGNNSDYTGFLKTGAHGSAQGNFGLMDLVAGLHWLRENIPAFGGDPDRITLMGHSTGAALANFIAVSPVAKEFLWVCRTQDALRQSLCAMTQVVE
uniref:Carboxylic ester hydrolase n=1 Tax=Rhodnius prolixus TaxID=13249 RepID=T1HBV0_RHOPR